jgi:hypothetical protein
MDTVEIYNYMKCVDRFLTQRVRWLFQEFYELVVQTDRCAALGSILLLITESGNFGKKIVL